MDISQYEFESLSRKARIKSAVESVLFISGEPFSIKDLAANLELEVETINSIVAEMIYDYEKDDRGIRLIEIDEKLQLVTKEQNSIFIQRMLKKNKKHSLSQASIESLAIIAYKQPITRIDIDEIRGVKSESAVQRLLERNLICDKGRLEVPGRPILYGTTDEFLRQFKIKSLDELPSLDLYKDVESDEVYEESAIDLIEKAMLEE